MSKQNNGIDIRDKKHHIKATVRGMRAAAIMKDAIGYWSTIQYVGKPTQSCLVLTQNAEFVSESYEGTTILYLFEGDRLIPE